MFFQACARPSVCAPLSKTCKPTLSLSQFVARLCAPSPQHLQKAKSSTKASNDGRYSNMPCVSICQSISASKHTASKHHYLDSVSRSFAANTCSLTGSKRLTEYRNSHLNMSMERSLCTTSDRCNRPVGDVLEEMQQVLVELGVLEPRKSVEFFIAHVLGMSTLHGVSADRELTGPEVERVWEMVKLRQQRMPVQYILGEWDFCDIVLKMRQPVFIPRPETEELVGVIKSYLKGLEHQQIRLLEIGCGSGAITLALLKEFPQMEAVAIDKTTHACELTAHNATCLGLTDRLNVIHLDISADTGQLGVFDVIVSNPPYVNTEDMGTLDPQVSRYEDHTALHGGGDGLDVVRHVLTKAQSLLTHKGTLWLEVDTPHPVRIQSLVEETGGLRYLRTLQDFTARDRFCVLQYSGCTR
ncbi:MTRF1L release factor glutamine methyltransferase-like [Haliotis rubra]|uniref:MTRF1L release factor glutamine methyltransferase-like n=1 Tax=Haliotis rubra TaxID=36100 RepID=UPI001EE62F5A|nr:MTRF1L release factor glutamine methyltransferase-like [Haliotis rubra]XP_046565980.1 MTRF1L release factor glutamine methyltransferase-like [Haliotis rubra]XP_046565981.1 MTRF1L release factor glutamine methyltransferase-like [Haliotis rubra]